jgi:hypothetical protein
MANVRPSGEAVTDCPAAAKIPGSGTDPVTVPWAESRTTASSPVEVLATVT